MKGIMTAIAMTALLGTTACGRGQREREAALPPQGGVTEQPTPAMPTPTEMPTTAATVQIDSVQGVGTFLTDGQARALYLLQGEPQNQSTCTGACAAEWPPFTTMTGGQLTGAMPIQQNLLGTLHRPDGTTQVTYGGHALYYYSGDQAAHQTHGQNVTDQWGTWYLVQPSGQALERAGTPAGGS